MGNIKKHTRKRGGKTIRVGPYSRKVNPRKTRPLLLEELPKDLLTVLVGLLGVLAVLIELMFNLLIAVIYALSVVLALVFGSKRGRRRVRKLTRKAKRAGKIHVRFSKTGQTRIQKRAAHSKTPSASLWRPAKKRGKHRKVRNSWKPSR